MIVDMEFDGQVLTWNGSGRFKATTGLNEEANEDGKDLQFPEHQCVKDKGPTPEGRYKVYITDLGAAKGDMSRCYLSQAWGVQTIPRGKSAGECEPNWVNWGYNRARLEPADALTRHACEGTRGGFYLHDSTKGYSHGCIEVETRFFAALKSRKATNGYFILKVKYVDGRKTNGGTRE